MASSAPAPTQRLGGGVQPRSANRWCCTTPPPPLPVTCGRCRLSSPPPTAARACPARVVGPPPRLGSATDNTTAPPKRRLPHAHTPAYAPQPQPPPPPQSRCQAHRARVGAQNQHPTPPKHSSHAPLAPAQFYPRHRAPIHPRLSGEGGGAAARLCWLPNLCWQRPRPPLSLGHWRRILHLQLKTVRHVVRRKCKLAMLTLFRSS